MKIIPERAVRTKLDIMLLRGVWAHKTSLTRQLFIEVSVPS